MIPHKKIIFVLIIITIVIWIIVLYFFYQKKENKIFLNISGAVVPHHNLVAAQRAEFFLELSKSVLSPKTIILLSPNHYSAGRGDIQTTDKIWHLNSGEVYPNNNVISFLTENNFATYESLSFTYEHGIYNILADIHNNFPNAKIVPIIFKDVSKKKLQNLRNGLLKSCLDCLMIASVDFSHYQPALLGELHDDLSIRNLQTLNSDGLRENSEVDSGSALTLLTMWARSRNTFYFNFKNHTNSGVIAKNPDIESTTHIFGWYEEGIMEKPKESVSFIIGGDAMFARGIWYKFGDNFSNAFARLGERVFWGTNAGIINLEGAITKKAIVNNIYSDNFDFEFSPEIAKTLFLLNINAVSQANNHSDNAGIEGLETTRSLLNTFGIQTFGSSVSTGISRVASFQGNGLSLSVIGVNLTYPGQKAEDVIPVIFELKKNRNVRIMVMPHWGEEYMKSHTMEQEKAAHMWIDAGADIIIGGHPHVIQDAEIYKNTPIIYSLGNLLFDQTFSHATQEGLLIAGKFTSKGLSFFALPTQSINYQPQLMAGDRKKEILEFLYLPFKNHIKDTFAGQVVEINK